MLKALLIILHVVVCLILVLVVLLQTGKRADLAGAFGGGGSQTVFGARGAATVLSKITTASAVLFMVTSLALAILSSKVSTDGGVLDALPASAPAPAAQEETVDTAPVAPALPEESESEPPAGTSDADDETDD
jgi:preprotein translocase subunit SecG